MRKYTQSEAKRLAAQVTCLEKILKGQKDAWVSDWPDSTLIAGPLNIDIETTSAVRTARKLKHAVVVTEADGRLYFHACTLPRT